MLGAIVDKDSINQMIEQKGLKYGIDPNLVRAFVQTESGFKPAAYRAEPKINDASIGLMQVLVKTAQWQMGGSVSQQQLYDPDFNLEVGAKYLRYLTDRYPNNLDDIIAAYNAGSAIKKKDGSGDYINQDYVNKVNRNYSLFKNMGVTVGGAIASSITAVTGGTTAEPEDPQTGLMVMGSIMAAVSVLGVFSSRRSR